ncbi:MAG: hypothetical protein ACXAC7_03455 [Candidatus Hodarchaeales archaeon]
MLNISKQAETSLDQNEKNLLTPAKRLRTVWLITNSNGIRSLALRNDLKNEALLFYILPGITLFLMWFSLILLNVSNTSANINLFSLLMLIIAPIIPETLALGGFIFSIALLFKLNVFSSDQKIELKLPMIFPVFSYVYFTRIIMVFSLSLQWIGRENDEIIALSYIIYYFFIFMFIIILAYSLRSITQSSISGSFIMAFFVFFISIIPSTWFFGIIFNFLADLLSIGN